MQRLRQAYTALREHGSVGYAKVAMATGLCDLDFIIIKATSPDDVPLPEKYVQEFLKIFSLSPSSSKVFSISFTRRFGKTQSWRVALKCLVLLHRLLRSLPDSNSFRSNILWSRSNGLLTLNPCQFRDASSSPSTSHDYTLFVRSYAHLLDEALNCISFDSDYETKEPNSPDSLPEKMREIGRVLDLLLELQSLIDRVIDCHPTGAAASSFIVRSAMKQIVRDSFACYATIRRGILVVLDNLFQLPYWSSISALRVYKKAATQATQLSEFYESCKQMGLCGLYEYPLVDKIPHTQVRALESFLHELWQMTESSSPSTSSTSDSPSSFTDGDGSERRLTRLQTVFRFDWENFEEEESEPLIQLERNDATWEELLEATARFPRSSVEWAPAGYGYGRDHDRGPICLEMNGGDGMDKWKVQVYNPTIPDLCNPFIPSLRHGDYWQNFYGAAVPFK